MATALSVYLRAVTDVAVMSVEQLTYSEVLMSLPDPTAFYAVSLAPFDGLGALELNPTVAFAMIDRMLGGTGRGMALCPGHRQPHLPVSARTLAGAVIRFTDERGFTAASTLQLDMARTCLPQRKAPSGRPGSRVGTGSPSWCAIPEATSRGTRTCRPWT